MATIDLLSNCTIAVNGGRFDEWKVRGAQDYLLLKFNNDFKVCNLIWCIAFRFQSNNITSVYFLYIYIR